MNEGNQALRAWLHDRIRARGPIPFVEYMEAALYHPTLGSYCRAGATTGPEGDFYTSPDLDPAFGLLISRQIAEIADRTSADPDRPFHVVEMGPGTGLLARDIVAGLSSERPDLARRVRYCLVEVSPSLRRVQEERLLGGEDGEGRPADSPAASIEWARWPELLERSFAGGFAGCVVANEFLDALPVHLVAMEGGRLKEVHVQSAGDRFGEVALEPTTDRLERHLEGLGIRLEEGQRAEICLRAVDWIHSLGRLFGRDGRGGAILVDYGHPATELYDPARHRGTLMCYHRHRAHEDPYAWVGEQDMTAHVDFTSVEGAARAAGFDVAPLTTQIKFLVALGLARMLAEAARRPDADAPSVRRRLALHGLMTPGGMGEVFKMCLLSRGAEAAALTGARDPFRDAVVGLET